MNLASQHGINSLFRWHNESRRWCPKVSFLGIRIAIVAGVKAMRGRFLAGNNASGILNEARHTEHCYDVPSSAPHFYRVTKRVYTLFSKPPRSRYSSVGAWNPCHDESNSLWFWRQPFHQVCPDKNHPTIPGFTLRMLRIKTDTSVTRLRPRSDRFGSEITQGQYGVTLPHLGNRPGAPFDCVNHGRLAGG